MGERGRAIDLGTVCRIERLLLTGTHSIYMVAKLCNVHHVTVTRRRDQLRASGKLRGSDGTENGTAGGPKPVPDSGFQMDVPQMRHDENDPAG